MPFITEELWQRVGPLASRQGDSIMLQPYPQAEADKIDKAAIAELEWVKLFIMGVRQIRSEMDIKPGKLLPVICQNGTGIDRQRINDNHEFLASLAKLESIDWLDCNEEAPESATSLVGDMRLLIPLAGLIDKDAELQRLHKNIQKLEQETQRLESKLNNDKFVANAREDVVNKAKEMLAEKQSALASLQAQADRIAAM